MNTYYVKQYNKLGEVTNSITKDAPYKNLYMNRALKRKIRRGKYKIITDKDGNFVSFGNRLNGNNRANTSKRKNRNSRLK